MTLMCVSVACGNLSCPRRRARVPRGDVPQTYDFSEDCGAFEPFNPYTLKISEIDAQVHRHRAGRHDHV